MNDHYKFETQCLHAGQEPDSSTEYGELLLRVEDEDGTIIEPEVFLPAAERFGQGSR